ncbi:MAG: glycosyltransferase [Bdellovibrionaceae bacterium]|nr:glycosyltransferase [Bdellovibrio sp.]
MRNVSINNLESHRSPNYFYRYKLDYIADFSSLAHARRISKARQNTTTCLLYDLGGLTETTSPAEQALAHSMLSSTEFEILFLVRPEQVNSLKTLMQETPYLISLSDEKDMIRLSALSANIKPQGFLLSPKTTEDFKNLLVFETAHNIDNIFWDFGVYDRNQIKSLSLKDIFSARRPFRRLDGLELWNHSIPNHFELEPLFEPQLTSMWQFKTSYQRIKLSVIIPSFNNAAFLANVIKHLIHQDLPPEDYEIIVVEDGGQDRSSEIIYEIFESYKSKINLKMIYWSKDHPEKGAQNFFRAGLARNLAVQVAEAENLFFLDSDMLTPSHFVREVLAGLEKYDLIQFERHHIHQNISLLNPRYQDIELKKQTYIEESVYWSQLFKAPRWMDLPNYWKFTCTYALGLKKKDFLAVGRFKKYYVSYGFEDTDLGYELFLRNKKCSLIKTPLLHLTSYNHMQYKNSHVQRLKLLRKTAGLFYLQHLNPEIYKLFGNFYSFEKPFKSALRDLIFQRRSP